MGGGDGLPGPTDAWVTLAGLARDTARLRLGTLVTSATFRLPGPLAISVAEVDHMSGGRVELGLGRGLVRGRAPRPTPSRSRRSGSASNGWRSSSPSSPGCGAPRPASASPSPAATTQVDGLPCAPEAAPAAPPAGHRRRPRAEPHAPARRDLRRRVQPGLRSRWRSSPSRRARVRAACEAIDRDPASLVFSAGARAVLRSRRRRVRAPRRRHRPRARGAARARGRRDGRRGRRHASPAGGTPGPTASISRSST